MILSLDRQFARVQKFNAFMTDTHPSHWGSKLLFGFLLAIAAAVLGYLLVYWWTFRNFNDVLDVSSLRNQVVSTQKASNVKDQLRDLGYSFQDSDFYQLNSPNSTNYRANVLEGYEPQQIENEEVTEEGYYFYDENGMAYYFLVDENNQIDSESMIPLISE